MYKTTIILFCCIIAPSYGYFGVYNGGGELWGPFDTLAGWDWENSVFSTEHLQPWEWIIEGGGPTQWRYNVLPTDSPGLLPYKGNRFILLTTSDEVETVSTAWRPFTVTFATSLRGHYFFGTNDYFPYNDYAALLLVPLDPNRPTIEVFKVDVENIGSYGSFGGWKRFQYDFTQEQCGEYYLVLICEDILDTIYVSFFGLDSVIACPNVTGPADLNCDCTVDFTDVAILINDLGIECIDQYADCLGGTDLNNDGVVDFRDLCIILDRWADGQRTKRSL